MQAWRRYHEAKTISLSDVFNQSIRMFHERRGVGNKKGGRSARDLSATAGNEERNKRGRKTWQKETYSYRPQIS